MLPIKKRFSYDRFSKCPFKQQSSLHVNYMRGYFKKFGVSSNRFPNVCPEHLSKASLCRYVLSLMLSSYMLCWQLCAFKDHESGSITKNQKTGVKTLQAFILAFLNVYCLFFTFFQVFCFLLETVFK